MTAKKRIALAATGALVLALAAMTQSPPRRLLVTVAEPLGEPLTAVEFDIRVDNRAAEVVRLYQPEERPVRLALLIDDSTNRLVRGSLPELAGFLRSLPDGSEVMLGYLRRGKLITAQAFTPELEAAARAVRSPSGVAGARPADLAVLLRQTMSLFPPEAAKRTQVLYVGQGMPVNPRQDLPLERAVREAQDRGIAIFVLHAPPEPTGRLPGAGQQQLPGQDPTAAPSAAVAHAEAYLKHLARATGGRVFGLGREAVSLDRHLDEYRRLLDRQYLVEVWPPSEQPTGRLTVDIRQRELSLLHPAR